MIRNVLFVLAVVCGTVALLPARFTGYFVPWLTDTAKVAMGVQYGRLIIEATWYDVPIPSPFNDRAARLKFVYHRWWANCEEYRGDRFEGIDTPEPWTSHFNLFETHALDFDERFWARRAGEILIPSHACNVAIPMGLPAVVFGAYPVIAFIRAPLRRYRRRRRRKRGLCLTCGYNLTGNTSGVCPECGTRVEASP